MEELVVRSTLGYQHNKGLSLWLGEMKPLKSYDTYPPTVTQNPPGAYNEDIDLLWLAYT